MKSHRNIRLVVSVAVLVSAFSAKAQLDTAWIGREYIHQYIVPHLIDPTLENYYWEIPIFYSPIHINFFYLQGDNPQGVVVANRMAQRYDIEDSVSLAGVAVYTQQLAFDHCTLQTLHETVRIGILDSSFNIIYEQQFIEGGSRTGDGQVTTPKAFTEFLFDETVTIRGSYFYAFVESSDSPCEEFANVITLTKFGYVGRQVNTPAGERVPCGYGTKYKPYIGRCDNRYGEWYYVDDITDWYEYNNYQTHAYQSVMCDCDSTIWPPAGIFPIRALENSSVEGVLGQKDLERSVSLYPNPAKGFIRVDSESNILKIEVYNVLNQLVETLAANSKTLTLDLKSYTSGTYFAKITTDLGTTTKKFVVE